MATKENTCNNCAFYMRDGGYCNASGNPTSQQGSCKSYESRLTQSIDWEQRRYEIAKDILGAVFNKGFQLIPDHPGAMEQVCNGIVETAVFYADALIMRLQKGGEK